MNIVTASDEVSNSIIECLQLKPSGKDGCQDIRIYRAENFMIKIRLNTAEDPSKLLPANIQINKKHDRQLVIKIFDFAHNPHLKYLLYIYLFAIILYCIRVKLGMRKVADITRDEFSEGEFRLHENEFKACTLSRAFKRLEHVKAYCESQITTVPEDGTAGVRLIETLKDKLLSDNPKEALDEWDIFKDYSSVGKSHADKEPLPAKPMGQRRQDMLCWLISIGLVTEEIESAFETIGNAASTVSTDVCQKHTPLQIMPEPIDTPEPVVAFLVLFRAIAQKFYLSYGRWIL